MENTENQNVAASTDDVINLDDGSKFVVTGSLSEQITNLLMTEYKKEKDEANGLVLESQVFQNVMKVQNYVEENKEDLTLKNEHVGVLFAINNIDAVTADLASLANTVSTMDIEQLRNTAVIIDLAEGQTIQPAAVAIESFCREVSIPVYYGLNKYMGKKKVV